MDIGCEHRYPGELRELTPLEEKLISLNSAYGFITKFNVQRGQQTGPTYRKHVVGHISVFPNDVESLAATILPHPLVSTLDQVHVIWSGLERPTPLDVSKLLSVRPGALRRALRWLQANNPLYVDIVLDEEEINSWSFENGSQVPTLAYQRMVREEETAEEAIRTAQIVPPSDRGQDLPAQPSTVEEIATELAERSKHSLDAEIAASAGSRSAEEATGEETGERLFELRSSAMFPLPTQHMNLWPNRTVRKVECQNAGISVMSVTIARRRFAQSGIPNRHGTLVRRAQRKGLYPQRSYCRDEEPCEGRVTYRQGTRALRMLTQFC
jgi:hypothetical protein